MSSKRPHFRADEEGQWNPERTMATIKPRGLNIVWGNDPRYWRLPEKGSDEAAELVQVSWFEVTGSIAVEQGKKYQISFEMSLKEDAFGWSGTQVSMMGKAGRRGTRSWKTIKPLVQFGSGPFEIPEDKMEVSVPEGGENQLYFGLYDVWNGKWKGGLRIHRAIIREVR